MKTLLYKGKEFFKDRKKLVILGVAFLILSVFLVVPSFAVITPIKSVEIESEKLSYSSNVPGAWKIIKNAKWISKGKAQITLDVSSVIKPNNEYTDVIFVLDTSGSMNENRLEPVKNQIIDLIQEMVSQGNKIAFITFNDTSSILSDFTDDSTRLVDRIHDITATGTTNYYQALINVESILKNYTHQENRDCVVLFLTDGLPNKDTPNEIAQYQNLKANYPYLHINAIQFEMGEELFEAIQKISDNQFVTNMNNLDKFLYKAAVNPVAYDSFIITDSIDDRYFTPTEVSASIGKIKMEGNKVSWDLGQITSGFLLETTTAVIDVNLKEELIGVGGLYPTNERLEVDSKIGENIENVVSTKTTILADNYQIIYEGNDPDGCSVTNVPNPKKASVFDTVSISEEEPSCDGYQFKGWEIVSENVTKVNANYFVMPDADVTVRAKWAKLSLTKSMDGEISKIQTLYQMMADNSVPDNIASTYVSSSTGINFKNVSSDTNGKGIYQAVKLEGEDTPIYYYRGAVTNNNVIFANFCWKIVRTTATKGVKLIYNGMPNEDGSCTATGTSAQIGTSAFNSSYNSIAYNGYMYGDVYPVTSKRGDIIGLGKKTEYTKTSQSTSNYIYSSTVAYDSTTGMYTLVDGENRVWNDTYAVGGGNQFLYTCFSETEDTCPTVYYVTRSNSSSSIYHVSLTGGELAEDTLNKEIVYGNDVDYDEITGMYTLKDTIKSKIGDWSTDYQTIGNGHHYTCLNETETCETVTYINYISSVSSRSYSTFYYTTFSNGITVEEAVQKMTTESEHTADSTIKKTIDTWYKNNMIAYTEKLEDTTWCNDKTIGTYGSWSKDGNAVSNYNLHYQNYNDVNSNTLKLTCRNQRDTYTTGDIINGNGDLEYPVGLLTADEIVYAGRGGSSYYLYTGAIWWSASPYYFYSTNAYGFNVGSGGTLYNGYVNGTYGVRPSVSLAPGTLARDGDGSPEDPFIVLTD